MQLTHNPNYQNFGPRLVASFIDAGIIHSLLLYSCLYLSRLTTIPTFIPTLTYLVVFVWLPGLFVYKLLLVILLWKTGYTPGKWLCGIRLANQDQQRLSFKILVFREYIAKKVSGSLFSLGYLNILVDPNHQAWHDHFTGSFAYRRNGKWIIGVIVLLLLIALEMWLGWQVVHNFITNQNLVGDLYFLIEPLVTLFTR